MEWPCTPKFPFYKYMKSDGTGQKSIQNAKGSHGLVRSTVVCSNLNTIFVQQGLSKKIRNKLLYGKWHYSQVFVDRENEGGSSYSGKCYWGDDFSPVEITPELPSWLQRDTVGTNIIILV